MLYDLNEHLNTNRLKTQCFYVCSIGGGVVERRGGGISYNGGPSHGCSRVIIDVQAKT